MLNVGIYLDELIMANGPIWIAPGPDVDGIPLNLPEGSAVIFDCTLAHKGGGNRLDSPRRAIFPIYGYYGMKRFETWMPMRHFSDFLMRRLRCSNFSGFSSIPQATTVGTTKRVLCERT